MDSPKPRPKRNRAVAATPALLLLTGAMVVSARRPDPMFRIAGEGCQLEDGAHVAKRNSGGSGIPGAVLMDMEINRCPESFDAAVQRIRPQLPGWTERDIGRYRPMIVFVRSSTPGGPTAGAAGMEADSVSIDVWPPNSGKTRVTATQRMRYVSAPASLCWLWLLRPEWKEPLSKPPEE